MDPLRSVVVQLDFVEQHSGPVIASSITYAGYVGVLTGVKKGLSISLNFRPSHLADTRFANFRFYFNHVLILLGIRQSISSLLRNCLLPPAYTDPTHNSLSAGLAKIEEVFPAITTTAAYIILSDGSKTVVLEKDRVTATKHSSNEFVVATNHDAMEEVNESQVTNNVSKHNAVLIASGMDGLVEESIERKKVVCNLWKESQKQRGKSKRTTGGTIGISTQDLIRWLNTYPITNEETHFATIMDAKTGQFTWIRQYRTPPTEEQTTTLPELIL